MPYGASKVYFDGSHYISIPQVFNVKNRKKAKIIKDDIVKKDSEKQVINVDELVKKDNVEYTLFDYLSEQEVKEKSKIEIKEKNEKKVVFLSDYFENYYKESLKLHKKFRFNYVLNLMQKHFKNNKTALEYVRKCFNRKEKNLISRRKRLSRKAFLNEFNYFATFTYDSKKICEEDFKVKLKKYLSNNSTRKGWRYIGVWERGSKSNRLHFHSLLYVPEETMPGEIIEKKDYSFSTHNLQITHQNTFFNDKFGRTDFERLKNNELGNAISYLMKYIEKSGEKIVYSRKLPQYFISDIMDYDLICDTGVGDRKKVLFNDFDCFKEGEYIGKANYETIRKMEGVN